MKQMGTVNAGTPNERVPYRKLQYKLLFVIVVQLCLPNLNKFTAFLLLVVSIAIIYATDSAAVYSLERVLSIAERNAKELKIIDIETDALLTEVDSYKSEVMPTLSFETGAAYLSQSQSTHMMERTMMAALYGSTDYNTTENGFIYPDRLKGSAINWSLNLYQPLNFFKSNTALKLARIKYCSAKDLKRVKKDQFYYHIIKKFLAVYSSQLNVAIHQASIDRAMQLKSRIDSEFSAGREIKREVLRIESRVQGNRARLFAAQCSLEIAQKQLFYTINYKTDSTIILELDEYGEMYTAPETSGPGSISLFLKHNEAALYKAEANYVRSQFFPTIGFIGSLSNHFISVDTAGLVYDLLPASSSYTEILRMEHDLGLYNPKISDYLNPVFFNWTLGIQLSWTFFDGFRTQARYRQARFKAQQVLMELDTLESNASIAIEETRYRVQGIENTISAVRLQVEAARQALVQTEQDYGDGVTDFITLLEVDNEHRESVRYLNDLKMQRVTALADLRIAMGLPVYKEHK